MNDTQTVQPADTDNWTRTTAEALAAFDQAHADKPIEKWTTADHDTWTNLHLAQAA